MGRRIRLALACTAVLFAGATGVLAQPVQVSTPQDASMTCDQLVAEAVRMDALVAASSQEAAGAANTAKGAGVATTLATEGLMRSGMLGRMPGVGMFANKANAMSQQRAAEKQQQEAQEIQAAQMRKTIMAALYQGKNCAAAPAAVTPASTPAVPAAK